MGIALENQPEGVLVGDVEKRQRRNRGMDVDRVQASAEHARRHAAPVQLFNDSDGRHIELPDDLALRQMDCALHVLGHHQPDVAGVTVVMVKGKTHQAAQGVLGRQLVQVELRLDAAHAPVGLLQHGKVQAFLAAEVVINHAFAGLGGRCYLVDARAAQAFFGKLGRCHVQDAGHGARRVVGAAAFARRRPVVARRNPDCWRGLRCQP